ncbi:MAG: hypothetical protein ABIP44_07290, partial [Pseudoxanthomonas sp.]
KSAVSVTATTFAPAPQNWSTMVYGSGIWIPLSGKIKEKFLFTAADQQELSDILRVELLRLAIFEADPLQSRGKVDIGLVFKQGTYEHAINEYTLTIEMAVRDADNRRFAKTYLVNSNEKSTDWRKFNTSVWQGKLQLAQITLGKLIPDIQEFLQRTQPADTLNVREAD